MSDGTSGDSGPSEFSTWAAGFARHMIARLEANAHKGGRENWLKDEPAPLLDRVQDELGALVSAVSRRAAPEVIWSKAASVANMAAMVADSYANGDHLKALPQSE